MHGPQAPGKEVGYILGRKRAQAYAGLKAHVGLDPGDGVAYPVQFLLLTHRKPRGNDGKFPCSATLGIPGGVDDLFLFEKGILFYRGLGPADWEQKEQSSEQWPDFALIMEQSLTWSPLKLRRTPSATSRRCHISFWGNLRTLVASSASIPVPDMACCRILFQNTSIRFPSTMKSGKLFSKGI